MLILAVISFAAAVWIAWRLIHQLHHKPDSVVPGGPAQPYSPAIPPRNYGAYPLRTYNLPVYPGPQVVEDVTVVNDPSFVAGMIAGELIADLARPEVSYVQADPDPPAFSGFSGGDSGGGGATSDWSSSDSSSSSSDYSSSSDSSSYDSSSSSSDF